MTPRYPTNILAEALSYDLGAMLLQVQPNNERISVVFASRPLTRSKMRKKKVCLNSDRKES